jgi:hypothetical protein
VGCVILSKSLLSALCSSDRRAATEQRRNLFDSPLIAGELFGVRVLGRLLGVVLTADGVAEALSPLGIGYLRDRTQSYHTGFIALIVMALVGAAAVGLLPRTKPSPSAALEGELQAQPG